MTTSSEIIEVPVAHLLEEADRKARSMGDMNSHTMRGLKGRQAGFLGELVAMEHLSRCEVDYEEIFSLRHDLSFKIGETDNLLEVKTKERTVPPKPEYDCSVPDYVKDFQDVDYYIFISLLSLDSKSEDINRFKSAYLLGSISKEGFGANSALWTTDSTDHTNGWKPTTNVWNVPISCLKAPRQIERVSA